MPTLLLDGRFTNGFYAGRARVTYPFQANGDVASRVITREFRRSLSHFIPAIPANEADPQFATARLMAETEPAPTGVGDVVAVSRTFATVPPDQITGGSRVITKPDAGSVGERLTTASDRLYASSALSSYVGYATYSGHVFGDNQKVYGPLATTTSANSGANTRITWSSHGLAGTEEIIARNSSAGNPYVIFAALAYSVIDANTIDLLGVNYGTNVTRCAEYLRAYTAGTDRVGCRFTQKFYLPGFTSGITTFADIPLPTILLNDAEFLSAVVANTSGFLTYDAGELTRWNGWPIYTQTLTEINMADV